MKVETNILIPIAKVCNMSFTINVLYCIYFSPVLNYSCEEEKIAYLIDAKVCSINLLMTIKDEEGKNERREEMKKLEEEVTQLIVQKKNLRQQRYHFIFIINML